MMQEMYSPAPDSADHILVSRQPIFDRNKNIWGYDLLLHKCSNSACALVLDPDLASVSTLVADGFVLGSRGLPPGKRICIHASLKCLQKHQGLGLPPKCVCLVLPASDFTPAALEVLAGLRSEGCLLAVNDYRGQEIDDTCLEIADIIKIIFAEREPQEIMGFRAKLKRYKASLAAVMIEDWVGYEGARALGFQYFQGSFFSVPEVIAGRKIPTQKTTRLRLVRALYDTDETSELILKAVATDPPLAYRLLRYINSPAFGLLSQVTSLKHAVALLGSRALKKWAMAAIVSDMDSSDKGSELAWMSLQRAFFLHLLAEQGLAGNWDSESIFLLGLFSTMDSLMGMPMNQVLEELSLEPRLHAALTKTGNVKFALLALLDHLEAGQLEEVRSILKEKSIPANIASHLYMRAAMLTHEAIHGGGESTR